MQAGTALIGRRFLAALVAALLMASVMFLLADTPAKADHLDTWPNSAAANDPSYWEQWGQDQEGEADWSCLKDETGGDDAYVVPSAPAGEYWRLLVVKAGGNNEGDISDLHWNPSPGDQFEHSIQGGWSHVILCSRPIQTTTAPEETTVPEETTIPEETTVPEETTIPTETTVPEETTIPTETTVPEVTTTVGETTTIPDEVLPTVITTSTTVASTSTSVEDEVEDTQVLPFTGGNNDMLALLAGGLGLLGALVLAGTRRMEDN